VWCGGILGCEAVAALSGDGLGGSGQDGGPPQAGPGAAPRLHRGKNQPDTAPDAARAEGGTGGPRREGIAQRGLAVSSARGAALQKKRCSRLSRPVPTS